MLATVVASAKENKKTFWEDIDIKQEIYIEECMLGLGCQCFTKALGIC
jgi:hypothetical protein